MAEESIGVVFANRGGHHFFRIFYFIIISAKRLGKPSPLADTRPAIESACLPEARPTIESGRPLAATYSERTFP